MKEKVIELNNIIDDLIDVAHEEYFHVDETEQVRLDGKIKAYWEVKDYVENILAIK